MPSIYDIKPAFQNVLRPIVHSLARIGVTANQVTVTAAILSLATGAVIATHTQPTWPMFLLPVILLVRMALNAIDGMLARDFGQKSPLGGLLNEVGDVVSDAAIYLPLSLVPGFEPRLIIAIVVLAAISELTGVAAVGIGASRRYDGPMGKSDRAFIFGAVGLALGLGLPSGAWITWVLAVIAILSVWTIINRIRQAVGESSHRT